MGIRRVGGGNLRRPGGGGVRGALVPSASLCGFTAESGFALSGAIADGQSLTLTKSGGGFGTKATAAPLWFEDCQGTVDEIPAGYISEAGTYSTGQSRRSGLTSWRFDYPTGTTGEGTAKNFGVNLTECYLTYWVYVHKLSGADRANVKLTSPVSDFTTYAPSPAHGVACAQQLTLLDGNGVYFLQPNNEGGANQYQDTVWSGTVFADWAAWRRVEFYWKKSTVDTADGVNGWWCNRKRIHRADFDSTGYDAYITDRTESPNHFMRGAIIGFYADSGADKGPLAIYYDDLYADSTRARVELADSATWSEHADAEYASEVMVPSAWTDGSITFTLRQGGFASLSGKTLFVVLADGSALKAGVFA